MQLFVLFNQVGVTLLVATHDLALVQALGRRVIHLQAGRLVADDAEPTA
jgi:cell division transport system ATP-binding protein